MEKLKKYELLHDILMSLLSWAGGTWLHLYIALVDLLGCYGLFFVFMEL